MNHEANIQVSGNETAGSTGLSTALRQDFLASIVVFLVALPLCMGIAIASGVPVAAGLITGIDLDVRLDVDQKNQVAVLSLERAATFIRLPLLASELERVPQNVELHVDFEHLNHVDHACLDLLMNWAKQHEGTGGTLVIDWESLHANFHSGPHHNQQFRRQTAA